jgi:cob(I)alamin adenosyltransferase
MHDIPTVVKVGAVDYRIVLDGTSADEYGACDTATQTIHLSKNQTAQTVADTMLHEIMHAIWNESGIFMHKRPTEETIVRTMSTWTKMVLRDNPHVAAFIFDATPYWPYTATPLEKAHRHGK